MPTARRALSSRVTVQNPRPRKYASAAEKQAAFRARFPTLCVRVEPKTADTIQKIGDASGRTQQETMLSLVKFALTNRDFVNLGLTEHKQLPRMDETRKANPMKKQPSAAQIAARERFAEMARSGAFTRSKSKRKKNPSRSGLGFEGYDPYASRDRLDEYRQKSDAELRYIIQDAGEAARAQRGMSSEAKYLDQVNDASTVLYERKMARSGAFTRKAKRNPAKKTVSQKISQLTREGYPQKQAVAIALSEERKGKVKRNPISDVAQIIYQQLGANRFAAMTGSKNFVAGDDYLMFSIPKNASPFNKVRVTLTPNDTYNMEFLKVGRLGDVRKTEVYEDVYADQLQELFRGLTGMETSLGTMGRRNNPRASNPAKRSTYQYALVIDDGGFSFGMDQITPVQFTFSAQDKKRGVYRSFKLPAEVIKNPEFQAWATQLPEHSIVISLRDLRSLIKQYFVQ